MIKYKIFPQSLILMLYFLFPDLNIAQNRIDITFIDENIVEQYFPCWYELEMDGCNCIAESNVNLLSQLQSMDSLINIASNLIIKDFKGENKMQEAKLFKEGIEHWFESREKLTELYFVMNIDGTLRGAMSTAYSRDYTKTFLISLIPLLP